MDAVKATIADAETRLQSSGRLLIRKSGTEPLIRVMAECEDDVLLNTVVNDVVDVIQKATAA
jgi:phosphoglucosamine mutase